MSGDRAADSADASAGLVAVVLASCNGKTRSEQRVASHALAQRLLDPFGAKFAHDPDGRPVTGSAVRVSLSYADGVSAVAFGLVDRLGVDIATGHVARDLDRMIGLTCTEDERRAAPAAPAARLDWFLAAWTGKEAALKAWGTGLAVPPALVPSYPVSSTATIPAVHLADGRVLPMLTLRRIRRGDLHVCVACDRPADVRVRDVDLG